MVQQHINNRDWSALAELWDEYRPDAHGIQRPVIDPKVKALLRKKARKDGVELPA